MIAWWRNIIIFLVNKISIVLALGSNQGNRNLYLKRALQELPIQIIRQSSIYENKALLPKNAPKSWDMLYLNMVVVVNTDLSPYSMLKKIKQVEKLLCRRTNRKWAPRTIDIDILLWYDLKLDDNQLTIPHKELYKRTFVLKPF